jgi:serine/threonine protein kinase
MPIRRSWTATFRQVPVPAAGEILVSSRYRAGVIAGRYRLTGALGEGGMGRVWAARDELLHRDVALKELVLPRGSDPAEVRELQERAIREARSTARINHPNVVRVFDVINAEDGPWIVMELVPSRSLHDLLRAEGTIAPEQAAEIGLAVLAGLRAAHEAGVLHRDVKPANVLLSDDGRAVLTDFGLAQASGDSALTTTGIVVGSPSYLAPERALDSEISPAADLWSLGATIYTAVEGRPPYDKRTPVATLAALATQPPRPPQQAGPLRPALEALLQKDPAHRADVDTAERLLREAIDGPTENRGKGRKRWLVGALGLLLIAGGIAAARPMLSNNAAEAALPAAPTSPVTPKTPPKSTPTTQKPTPTPRATTATKATPSAVKVTTKAVNAVNGIPIHSSATGDCLNLNPDQSIVLWSCNGTDAQKFDLAADGTLRVRGKCVQVLSPVDGARLTAADCSGLSVQQWSFNAAYDLVNLGVVKCTDVPEGRTEDGTPAQVWACTGGANQKWHR